MVLGWRRGVIKRTPQQSPCPWTKVLWLKGLFWREENVFFSLNWPGRSRFRARKRHLPHGYSGRAAIVFVYRAYLSLVFAVRLIKQCFRGLSSAAPSFSWDRSVSFIRIWLRLVTSSPFIVLFYMRNVSQTTSDLPRLYTQPAVYFNNLWDVQISSSVTPILCHTGQSFYREGVNTPAGEDHKDHFAADSTPRVVLMKLVLTDGLRPFVLAVRLEAGNSINCGQLSH